MEFSSIFLIFLNIFNMNYHIDILILLWHKNIIYLKFKNDDLFILLNPIIFKFLII